MVIENIYIIGLGALGSIYAAKLMAAKNATVKIIADQQRIKTFKKLGVTINNKSYDFDFITSTEKQKSADLIIIAVKNAQLKQAINEIKPFIGGKTIVMSLLNGISSEAIIGNEIGHQHILYAFGVGMDSVRNGTNINYTNPGKLVFGEKDNTVFSERVLALKNLFEQAEIPHEIPVNMLRALWFKFMLNVGVNQVSAVLKAPYGIFQQNNNAKELMLMAAEEVVKLSAFSGIYLNQSDLNKFVSIMNTLDPIGKTSMLQDIEAKRKTEVDLFAGTVIDLGKNYNMATPINEMLFKLIKVLEEM